MKPFVLLATRDHDEAAEAEYHSVLRHTGLDEGDLIRLRVEAAPLPELDVDDFSGFLLGGSSFSISDPVKSELQQRVESDLGRLLGEVVRRDVAFLGMCYGIGTITSLCGGVVDATHAEPVGGVGITVTDAGTADPLLEGVGGSFIAFVGHKESCARPPADAVVLATGEACPVQMYRLGRRVYVTQFHPELDANDLAQRMRIYSHAGYFAPDELDDLIAMARASGVDGTQHRILRNFVTRFAQSR